VMAKRDVAYLIALAESMGGMTGPLRVSVFHAEVAHAKASALLNVVGSSFTPRTSFSPWMVTSSHQITYDHSLFLLTPLVWG